MTRYKQIIYHDFPEISMMEFDLYENEINGTESFILKISELLEIVGYKRPKYVLFNKQANDFEIDKDLYNFAHKHVFDVLNGYAVKETFFLVNNERYEKYQKMSRPNVLAFKEKSDILRYIENKNQ